jgi:hypothetical protein
MNQLGAVNNLLSIIGEAPVDNLSDTTVNEITDSCLALRTLDEVTRDVQAEGWDWNTNCNVVVQKDSANHYPLRSATLGVRFSPNRYPTRPFVQRGNRLYDRQRGTFEIGDYMTEPIVIDEVIYSLGWDEMPHVAQQYIMIRAGRIFADRFINSNAIYVYTSQDEEYARAMLIRGEERSSQNNLLWGNNQGLTPGIGYIPATGIQYRGN